MPLLDRCETSCSVSSPFSAVLACFEDRSCCSCVSSEARTLGFFRPSCAVWIVLCCSRFHQCGTRNVCAHADRCEPERYVFFFLHMCVSRVAHQHTQRTLIMSVTWWCLFYSLNDHWVSADRPVNRRRRGSRSLRRARPPNSWRHDNNTLRYHCALSVAVRAHCAAHDNQILGATTTTPFDTTAPCVHQLRSWRAVGSGTRPRTSCRTTDCRGNWTRAQSAEKRDTSALGAPGSGP